MTVTNWNLFKSMLKNLDSFQLNKRMLGYKVYQTLEKPSVSEIRNYAESTLDFNPSYSGSNPYLPPFFVSKLIFPKFKEILVHPDLNLNLLRMVHGEQEIKWIKPLKRNDRLDLKMRVSEIKKTSSGELLNISGQLFSNDSLAVEAVSGLVVRSKKRGVKKSTIKETISEELFKNEINTERYQQYMYARASGDTNFIHTSPLLAKMAGLPGTVLHGVCVMAMSGSLLINKVIDNDLTRLKGIKGRFGYPVIPGEKLFITVNKTEKKGEVSYNLTNKKSKMCIKDGLFQYKTG